MSQSILRFTILTAALVCTVFVGGCGSSDNASSPPTASIEPGPSNSAESLLAESNEMGGPASPDTSSTVTAPAAPVRELYPEVVIETSLGSIKVKLNAELAPQTVDNFLVNYVDRGFYSDTIFHHVEKDFIAICGGYTSDLKLKEHRTAIHNEADNGLTNERGTIAMSREYEYVDSATSQFFFNLVDNPSLDYQESEDNSTFGYCVFGEVIEGMDVVDRIAESAAGKSDEFTHVPTTPIVIQSATRIK